MQAALTGHLVFSTLHTNTASGAISRLADLGVEPFLIASTVIGVVAQRLLRLICPHCAQPASIDDDAAFLLGLSGSDVDLSKVRKGRGCEKCRKTGYFGRTAALEILPINRRISAMIRDGINDDSVTDLGREAGVQPLMKAATQKLLAGETTSEEVLRVIPLVT